MPGVIAEFWPELAARQRALAEEISRPHPAENTPSPTPQEQYKSLWEPTPIEAETARLTASVDARIAAYLAARSESVDLSEDTSCSMEMSA